MFVLQKKEYEKLFLIWIISVTTLLILMIFVGGLTRLTDSGLSITEWNLFTGILPPLNTTDWENSFSLYKEIPQYKLLNSNMSLNEFKIIFLWEYAHRLLGRIIGLVYLIPLIFFIYNNSLTKEYKKKFIFIFILILFQGIIGWYMVISGLTNNVTVSHYRLSIHLFFAFLILSSLFWILLNLKCNKNNSFFFNNSLINITKLFIILLYLQIIFGAFVSGLDAGKIYQTWPLMGDKYFPDDVSMITLSSLLNFDDQSIVQFFHRNLAYLIFLVFIYIGFIIFRNKYIDLYKSYKFLSIAIVLQILLGVFTLISNINTVFASLHQISSIVLIFFSLNLYHCSIK